MVFSPEIFMKIIVDVIGFLSNFLTVIVSCIVIYLYISKRDTISSAIELLTKYSSQISMTELNYKLERIAELSAEEESSKAQIVNILNEIVGQIRGNSSLKKQCAIILKKLAMFADNPDLITEPKKRSIVSELRETLRYIDLISYNDIIGGKK